MVTIKFFLFQVYKTFHWVYFLCNVSVGFHFLGFGLVSSRSYTVMLIPTLNKFHNQTNKAKIRFSKQRVLKNNKVPGKDCVSNEIMKCSNESIIESLQFFFNTMIDTDCIIPWWWFCLLILSIQVEREPNQLSWNYFVKLPRKII